MIFNTKAVVLVLDKDDISLPPSERGSSELIARADIVIHNGRILKNRYGVTEPEPTK
jgi:hypothetical protein